MASNNENKYELMVIVDSGIGQAAVTKRLESIKKQIAKHGEIFFEDIWGERDLAYTMKKASKGHYAVFGFSFEPSEMKEFETGLRLEPEVIRHLIVKLPLKYEPKTLEQMKEEHEKEAEEAKAEKKA
ncbi:30S ribosomal protein S6 [Candidatus Peregrinibacteria bacterium]|nr:30S ribosomal protein S6 [Candidatus Peregrinibacteria bacterium]